MAACKVCKRPDEGRYLTTADMEAIGPFTRRSLLKFNANRLATKFPGLHNGKQGSPVVAKECCYRRWVEDYQTGRVGQSVAS